MEYLEGTVLSGRVTRYRSYDATHIHTCSFEPGTCFELHHVHFAESVFSSHSTSPRAINL